MNIFKIHYLTSKIPFSLYLFDFFTQKESENMTKRIYNITLYVWSNASKENFTQPLVVMVETFRKFAHLVDLGTLKVMGSLKRLS